jgi:hypothetical protein
LDQYTNKITPSLQFQFFHNEWLDGYIPPKRIWLNQWEGEVRDKTLLENIIAKILDEP